MTRPPLRAAPLAALLAWAFAAACSSGSGYTLCYVASDCGGAEACVDGVCAAADAGPAPGSAGSACAAKSDCASGLSCISAASGFPGGYCSIGCSATPCPTGATCEDLTRTTLGTDACLATCSSSSECRSGYSCCAGLDHTCAPSGFCATGGPP